MSSNGFEQQPVPYHLYEKQNSAIKRFRQAKQRAEKELEDLRSQKAEADDLLRQLATAYKEVKADPRLQLTEEQYNEYQGYTKNQLWTQHEDQFKGALDGLLAEGVTPTQILRAVGYSPEMVEQLTPEILQDVVNTAYQEFPQLFQSVSQENAQAEPADASSVPGQMNQAFEQGSVMEQQAGRQLFEQSRPQMAPQGFAQPSQQAQRPQGFQPPQTPSLQFKGYGDLQGRGGPAPTKLPTVSARLRDAAWMQQNQGALAQAVANGATIVAVDD